MIAPTLQVSMRFGCITLPACVLLTDQERNKVRLLEQELKTARLALLRYQNGNDMTEAEFRLRRQRIADLEEMLFKITHLPNNRPSATGTGILAQKQYPPLIDEWKRV